MLPPVVDLSALPVVSQLQEYDDRTLAGLRTIGAPMVRFFFSTEWKVVFDSGRFCTALWIAG